MKILTNLSSFNETAPSYVTIGTFDGVHIGHQKVLKKLVKSAKKNNATPILLTFFPHPRMVLQKEIGIKLINTIDERIQLLEKTGIETLVVYPFDEDFANQTALNFVRNFLVAKLNIAKLFIGYDHRFGKNREGDFEHLKEYGYTYNFSVKEISKLDINNIGVSSTKIRKAIENGEITKANQYLGYHFMLTGKVVEGKNLGEKIGFPTANLFIKETYKLIPKTGAYIVKSTIDNEVIYGMMNIGFRPTLKGKHQTIEIHFFNFKKDLYTKTIQIEVLKFLRDEQKFESIQNLKKQLQTDKQNSLKYIRGTFID
ncbi:MAG: bifunctional riboflavin kinase/FAD synthetase [Lutibacter sp.]|uniref:bifunctional riboflavin kinase/FAD synthetase n=1 Tax=Lutibacter sp. TaxID=1925666 RepID=UPI00299EBC0A|nr:bifunctional riboflavin kinase/FAD synthetase [Lutibacter sp.]MDX1829791.1 bifunctional riboflavin kinase/FAD synthetase [Lutibacter sp.]